MQILQIILSVAGCIAYIIVGSFACIAYSRLNRQEKLLEGLAATAVHTEVLMTGLHISNAMKDITEMKKLLQEFVDDDRFEDAENLRSMITDAEKSLSHQIEKLKDLGMCKTVEFEIFKKDQ